MKFHEIFLSTRMKSNPEIKQKKQGFCLIRTKYNYPVPGVRSGFGFAFAFGFPFPFPFAFPVPVPVPVRAGPRETLPAKVAKLNKAKHKL